jgi:hypothetical protein
MGSGVGLHADNTLRAVLDYSQKLDFFKMQELGEAESFVALTEALYPFVKKKLLGKSVEYVWDIRPEKDHYYSAADHREWLAADADTSTVQQAIDRAWSLLTPGVIHHYSSDVKIPSDSKMALLGTSLFLEKPEEGEEILHEISTLYAESENEEKCVSISFLTWSRQGEFVRGYQIEADSDFFPQSISLLPHHNNANAEIFVLSLPAYFAYRVDLIVQTKRKTRKAKTDQNSALDDEESQEDIQGKPGIDYKMVSAIRRVRSRKQAKTGGGKTGVWAEPNHRVPVRGYWRRIKPENWGHGPDGEPELGRT